MIGRTLFQAAVSGKPVPKQSHGQRGMRTGEKCEECGQRTGRGMIQHFQPKTVTEYERLLGFIFLAAMRKWKARGVQFPIDVNTPLVLGVAFAMPQPKTMPKGRVAPTCKPDETNLIKPVEDALESCGVLSNDSQIVVHRTGKYYVDSHKEGGVFVHIQVWESGMWGPLADVIRRFNTEDPGLLCLS